MSANQDGIELEEGLAQSIDFSKLAKIGEAGNQVVPVVLQDAHSLEVLFVGYANAESLQLSMESGSVVLYSTSRNELWHKGSTSGDTLKLLEVRVNCEQNSLLFLVEKARTGVCHTKDENGNTRGNCFYRKLTVDDTLAFT